MPTWSFAPRLSTLSIMRSSVTPGQLSARLLPSESSPVLWWDRECFSLLYGTCSKCSRGTLGPGYPAGGLTKRIERKEISNEGRQQERRAKNRSTRVLAGCCRRDDRCKRYETGARSAAGERFRIYRWRNAR